MRHTVRLAVLVLLSASLAYTAMGCRSGPAATNEIDVFAAASLTGALTQVAADFEAVYPGAQVNLNFAGSSTLREQLLDGAQADVFVAASQTVMDDVVTNGLVVDGTVTDLGANVLVLAVPEDNPAGIVEYSDLARDDLLVGACAVGVPCGNMAQDLMSAAGIAVRVDTAAPDAGALARRLRDGELDAGLVYRSDVIAGGLVEVDLGVDPPATTYPMATLHSSELADHFVDFVVGGYGERTLREWGIQAP